jgi:membrane-associated protein
MHLEHLLSPLLQLTSSFSLRTAALLFLLCAVGEATISVPYILESVWLLVGYHFGAGVLSPLGLLGLWLAVVAGRETGALVIYRVLRFGAGPLARLYDRFRRSRFWPKGAFDRKLSDRISALSSFSGAYARLVGLSFPLVLALAHQRRPLTLVKAVALASVAWDSLYIMVGATVGTKGLLSPEQMLVASLIGLTALYAVVLLTRRLFRRRQPVRS